jgi:error-prone DNA polymerase
VDERRQGGPFVSFDDFLRRVAIEPSDVARMIRAGAFDAVGFGAPAGGAGAPDLALRPRLHWRLREWEARTSGRRAGIRTLFPPEPGPLPDPRPYDAAQVLRDEEGAIGFLVSRHPLTLYADRIRALQARGVRPVRATQLGTHVGRTVRTIGWLITGKIVSTGDDEPMEFVSFEDTTAIYETTFFPRPYARFCRMLTTARPYLLTGKVEEDFGALTVTVEEVAFLDAPSRVAAGAGGAPAPFRGATIVAGAAAPADRRASGSGPAAAPRARPAAGPDRPA